MRDNGGGKVTKGSPQKTVTVLATLTNEGKTLVGWHMHVETQIWTTQNIRKRPSRVVINEGANHGMGSAIILKVITPMNQSIYVKIRWRKIGEKIWMIKW
jgi:hypothetical protein